MYIVVCLIGNEVKQMFTYNEWTVAVDQVVALAKEQSNTPKGLIRDEVEADASFYAPDDSWGIVIGQPEN